MSNTPHPLQVVAARHWKVAMPFMASEFELYKKVIQEAGIKAE